MPGEKFMCTVRIGNTFYTFKGHCNKSRGDFYIRKKEWKHTCNVEFSVGSTIKCEIVNIEKNNALF